MNGNTSTNSYCPLFPEEPDVWESFDNQTQQEVECLIARLLATNIEQSVPKPNNPPSTKENQL